MDPVTILYFIEPATGEYRSSCPSTDGRLLDTWDRESAVFRARWDARGPREQWVELSSAVDWLRNRRNDGFLRLPGLALGSERFDGMRAAYRAVGRRGDNAVLLLRVGTAKQEGSDWQITPPPPVVGNEFWWALNDDVQWLPAAAGPKGC